MCMNEIFSVLSYIIIREYFKMCTNETSSVLSYIIIREEQKGTHRPTYQQARKDRSTHELGTMKNFAVNKK